MKAFAGGTQTTLRDRVELTGIGVHGGRPATVTLLPADADTGIVFLRTDLEGRQREIPAHFRHVGMTDWCTSLSTGTEAIGTVEHLMAAFAGLGVDNALVEVDGPEVPIMDGSAAPFSEAIDCVGLTVLKEPRRLLRILKPVRVEHGASFGELRPHDRLRLEVEIDFPSALIGRQQAAIDIDPQAFRKEIARARTFGFFSEAEKLWAHGFALGASLDNAVVLAEDRVMNAEGLRFADEFVRHKALDALGDLALAGMPILGCYRSYRGGHCLNVKMLEAVFADSDAYEVVELPVRREVEYRGEVPALAATAAFRPDGA